MVIFRSIHVLQMTLFHSFLWPSNIPQYIYIHHILIQLCTDGHLGYFQVLAIVNSASMNIGVCVSLWIWVFSRYMPKSGFLDHMIALFFSFLRNLHTLFHSGCTNLCSKGRTSNVTQSSFLPLPSLCNNTILFNFPRALLPYLFVLEYLLSDLGQVI